MDDVKHLIPLAFVVTLAPACGGGDSVPLSQLGGAMGETICAKMVECCTTEELMAELLGASNEGECREVYAGIIGGLLVPALEDSVNAGRMTYDGEAMAACLDTLAGISCAELRSAVRSGIGDSCEDPFIGHVATGGVCAGDPDCTSGFCNGDSIDFDGNITYGACADVPAIGQPCVDGDCPGLRCDRQTTTCAAKLADGETCTFDDDCASDECVDGGTGSTCGRSMTCDGN